jgi:hypothetical protein
MVTNHSSFRKNGRTFHIYRLLAYGTSRIISFSKKGFPENERAIENPCLCLTNNLSPVITIRTKGIFSPDTIKSNAPPPPILFHYPHVVTLVVKVTDFPIRSEIGVNA